jgi:hypothetical protein
MRFKLVPFPQPSLSSTKSALSGFRGASAENLLKPRLPAIGLTLGWCGGYTSDNGGRFKPSLLGLLPDDSHWFRTNVSKSKPFAGTARRQLTRISRALSSSQSHALPVHRRETHARSVASHVSYRRIVSLSRCISKLARDYRHYLKPFSGDGMVLHRADKTSARTTSAANSMLAISENVACSGCACKWRPRSVLQRIGVRMAALLATPNHIPKKHGNTCRPTSPGLLERMYDLLLSKGAPLCPSRNSGNSSRLRY